MGSRRWVPRTTAHLLPKILVCLHFLLAIALQLPCEASIADRIRALMLNRNSDRIKAFFGHDIFGRDDVPISTDQLAIAMNKVGVFGKVTFVELKKTMEGLQKCAREFPDDILLFEKKEPWERFYFVHDWFSVNPNRPDHRPNDVISSLAHTIIYLWEMPCHELQQKNFLSFTLPTKQLRNFALLTLMVHRAQIKWMKENEAATKKFSGRELLYMALLHFLATQTPSQFEKMNAALKKNGGEEEFMKFFELAYFSNPYQTREWNRLWDLTKTSEFGSRHVSIEVTPLDWTVAIPEKFDALRGLTHRVNKMLVGIANEKQKRVSPFLPCFYKGGSFYDASTQEEIKGKDVYIYKYMKADMSVTRYFDDAELPPSSAKWLAALEPRAKREFLSLAPLNCTSKENAARLGKTDEFYVITKSKMKEMLYGKPKLLPYFMFAVGVLGIFVAIATYIAGLPLFIMVMSGMGVIAGGAVFAACWGVAVAFQKIAGDVMGTAVRTELSRMLARINVRRAPEVLSKSKLLEDDNLSLKTKPTTTTSMEKPMVTTTTTTTEETQKEEETFHDAV